MNDKFNSKDKSQLGKLLEDARKKIAQTNQKFGETLKETAELFNRQMNSVKTIVNAIKNENNKIDFVEIINGGMGEKTSQAAYKYNALRAGVDADESLSESQKIYYKNNYNLLEAEETKKAYEDSLLGKTNDKLVSDFSSGLQSMIKGYKSFSDVMKDMTVSLTDFMIKQFTDKIAEQIFSQQSANVFSTLFGGLLNRTTGGIGKALGVVGSLFSKHHSGGIVPAGANYSLPGTEEQLALLKGGERVLSPSENVNYESQNGSSPVIFNSFNIKAWDSKDVSKYLLENRQLLNQITFQGIKDNSAQLRTMVRNA